jgi:hypothetical protein
MVVTGTPTVLSTRGRRGTIKSEKDRFSTISRNGAAGQKTRTGGDHSPPFRVFHTGSPGRS